MASTRLPPTDRAPSLARAFVREHLCRSHGDALADDAELLTSEVVTNAVRHGGPPISIQIDCTVEGLLVSVSDGSSDRPARHAAQQLDTHGRGMDIISTLADGWGIRQHAADAGKDVWFTLA